MSMTREEAILELEIMIADYAFDADEACAFGMAVSALRHREWEEQLWHDAKSDPPKITGLYYGKKDDTNSMYACQYRDGVWFLDMYPQQKIDIMQWANYMAFSREGE